MELSEIGKVAKKCWVNIPKYFPFVKLDKCVIMPNHIHGIIAIKNKTEFVGTQYLAFTSDHDSEKKNTKCCVPTNRQLMAEYKNRFGPQSNNLSSIIRGFKTGVTMYARKNSIDFHWQPRFHDRIIRDKDELNRIRKYIVDNPLRWSIDRNNSSELFF